MPLHRTEHEERKGDMKERRYTRSLFYARNDYHVRMSRSTLNAFTVLMAGIGIVALILGVVNGLYSVGVGFGGLAGALVVALFPRLDPFTVLLICCGILALIIGPVIGFYSWGLGAVLLVAALVLAASWRVYLVGNRRRYYIEPTEYWDSNSGDLSK